MEGRQEAGEGDDRGERGEEQAAARVEVEHRPHVALGGQQRREEAQDPGRDADRERASNGGQHRRLGEQEGRELPPLGAQRETHRDLAAAQDGADEEQVRDVGGGDEQHEAGDAEQQQQRRPHVLACPALPPPAGSERRLAVHEPGLVVLVAGLQGQLDVAQDRPVDGVEGVRRALGREARREAPEGVQEVEPAVLEAGGAPGHHLRVEPDRDVEVRPPAQRAPDEIAGQHPDDLESQAVDNDPATHDAGVATEAGEPGGVVEHGDARRVPVAVVVRAEEPPDGRPQPERGEVAAGDERPRSGERLVPEAYVGAEGALRRDARERQLRPLEVAEHRVAPGRVGAARVA